MSQWTMALNDLAGLSRRDGRIVDSSLLEEAGWPHADMAQVRISQFVYSHEMHTYHSYMTVDLGPFAKDRHYQFSVVVTAEEIYRVMHNAPVALGPEPSAAGAEMRALVRERFLEAAKELLRGVKDATAKECQRCGTKYQPLDFGSLHAGYIGQVCEHCFIPLLQFVEHLKQLPEDQVAGQANIIADWLSEHPSGELLALDLRYLAAWDGIMRNRPLPNCTPECSNDHCEYDCQKSKEEVRRRGFGQLVVDSIVGKHQSDYPTWPHANWQTWQTQYTEVDRAELPGRLREARSRIRMRPPASTLDFVSNMPESPDE